MFVHTFRRRHEDACHRFALRSPTDPEGAPRAQPSLRHLLRPRIETLQHGGRSGISLLHRRIFTIVRVSDDPPGDGQQAPDRVIDGGQHCDHCKTARTTRLGHQAGLVWSVRRHPDGHDDGIQHRVHYGGSFVRVGGLVYGASDGVHESLSREAHSRRDRAVGSQGQFVSVYLVWW